VNIAKRLGLPTSTLNSIFAKKDEIREQIEKCGNACKKRKNGKESTFAELKMVLFTWYQQAWACNIPIDGTTLREKAKIIATQLNTDNFSAPNGWVSRFKDRHCLVFKKLVGESAEVSVESLKAYYRKGLVHTFICLMESGKEVKKKINILKAMHYIMAASKK
jgi:hypothetical protein